MINLISHIDLDGYGCNILMQKTFGWNMGNVINVNYDGLANALMDMDRDETLFITDLSIPENLKGLLEEFSDLKIIDHHESSKWILDWAKGMGEHVKAVISTERCATYLLGEYLNKTLDSGMHYEWAKPWMDIIDDYDRWIHADPDSDRLNALLYISNRNRFVTDALNTTPQGMLSYNKDRIDRYINTRTAYVDTVKVIPLEGMENVGFCFAEKYRSHVGSANIRTKDQDGFDLLFILDMREGIMSVRSSELSDYDCSEICKEIDEEGGGHINAGGCAIPPAILNGSLSVMDVFKWIMNGMKE